MDEHSLGRLVHFESNFDRWRPGQSTRAWKEETDEGGILFDLGTHLVDQALVLFGQPAAVGAEVRRERDGEGSNDAITIRLHYFTGFSVTLGANCLSSLARPRFHLRGHAEISGSGDWIRRKTRLARSRRSKIANWGQEPTHRWGTLSVDRRRDSFMTPVGPVARRLPALLCRGPRCPAWQCTCAAGHCHEAWRVARVLEWAKESSEEQRDIECDWSGEPCQ